MIVHIELLGGFRVSVATAPSVTARCRRRLVELVQRLTHSSVAVAEELTCEAPVGQGAGG